MCWNPAGHQCTEALYGRFPSCTSLSPSHSVQSFNDGPSAAPSLLLHQGDSRFKVHCVPQRVDLEIFMGNSIRQITYGRLCCCAAYWNLEGPLDVRE